MTEEATLDEFNTSDTSEERAETPIGKTPDDWNIDHLENVANINSDGFSEDDWPSKTFEYISLSKASNGAILDSKTMPLDEAPSRAQRRVQQGDVLVGTVRPKQESHGFITAEHDGKVCSSGFGVLRTRANLNSLYLLQEVLSHRFFSQMEAYVAGSGYPAVKISDLKKHRVPVPTLEEQRKIATVLCTVDQAIQKTEKIIEQYNRVQTGLIQDIATTGIGHEDLMEKKIPMLPDVWKIPEHWELEFLEDITSLVTDGAHQTPTYVDEGVPFLKVENIKEDSINWDSVSRIPQDEHQKLTKRSDPQKGDVLLSKNGTIGISKVVDWNREFSHFVSLCLIRPQQERVLAEYLAAILESQICMHQARVRSKTNTVTNLHLEEIKRFSIPVPPRSEQEEILDKFSVVEDSLSVEKRFLKRLQRLKQGLMQDLLSGIVRTHETDIDIPEAVLAHG